VAKDNHDNATDRQNLMIDTHGGIPPGRPNRLGEVREPVAFVAAFANSARSTVVVNNAGHSLFGAAKSPTDEQSSIRSVQTCSAQSRRCAPRFRICTSKGRRIIQLSTYGVQGIFPGGSLSHASKWGVEGFFDSMMQELACFHFGVTIVVPPPAAGTNLYFGVAQAGRKLDANAGTATSMVHPILEDSSDLPLMLKIIIDCVDQNLHQASHAPKRCLLCRFTRP
jgi:NAD(P)-dependent dehydrogenase (short-subunit alcohol dehydrogenase family)